MNRKNIVLSAVCILSMTVVLIGGISSVKREKENRKQVYTVGTSAADIQAARSEPSLPGYLVKEQEGKLAVFAVDNIKTPVRTTDIYVETLRRYDQDMLKDGITVYGDEALWRILEDFGS